MWPDESQGLLKGSPHLGLHTPHKLSQWLLSVKTILLQLCMIHIPYKYNNLCTLSK